MKTYNLATKADRSEMAKSSDEFTDGSKYFSVDDTENSLEKLLKSGKTNLVYGKDLVGQQDGDFYFIKNGVHCATFDSNQILNSDIPKQIVAQKQKILSSFVLAPGTSKQKYTFVSNGDNDADQISVDNELTQLTISFNCLSRFYPMKNGLDPDSKEGEKEFPSHISKVCARIANGEIKVIHFTPDVKVNLTTTEKNILNKLLKISRSLAYLRDNMTASKPGYTLVNTYTEKTPYKWHMAATALLYDTVKGFTILLGQDEGSYFGCQLADNPKTIDAAFISLQPKEVRGTNSKRQGEWFFLKVTDVPADEKCIGFASSKDTEFYLNKETGGAEHYISSSKDIRITADGVYAFHPTMSHSNGDHLDVSETGWVKFCKNTAVRSFSVQGVD